jgi:hypothetical protein
MGLIGVDPYGAVPVHYFNEFVLHECFKQYGVIGGDVD